MTKDFDFDFEGFDDLIGTEFKNVRKFGYTVLAGALVFGLAILAAIVVVILAVIK